jgi:hypothetical protein
MWAAASACGPGPAPAGGLGFRDRTILTAEEIEGSRSAGWTAWDLIAKLRPEYLRSRGPSSLRSLAPVTAVVYVDEMRFGELDALRTMSVDQIARIQYLNASDATTRFGTDHFGGAILITTK